MFKLLGLVGLCLCAHPAFAAAALWEVSNGINKIWLGASLEALPKSAYPLPQEFNEVFQRADILVVERDFAAVTKPDFGVKVMQANVYGNGRNLKADLAPDRWQALEKYAQSRGVPGFGLMMFKPAFVAITLTTLESEKLRLVNGVAAHFFYRAQQEKKPVIFLETAEQQIQLLEKVNSIDANLLIAALLEELEDLSATSDQSAAAWRQGDMNKLDAIKGKKLRDQSPALYDELVIVRNRLWLSRLQEMLKTVDTEYVLIDAMHLSGPDNLLDALRTQGINVIRYQAHRPANQSLETSAAIPNAAKR